MRTIRYLLFLCIGLSFLINVACHGQGKDAPGHIIFNNGDTLKGFIKYGKRKKIFSVCNFRAENEKSYQVYLPGQLKQYAFTKGKHFESIVEDSTNLNYFAEQILLGSVSLLFNGELFFIKSDSIIETLKKPFKTTVEINKQEVWGINTMYINKETKPYLNTLRMRMKENPEINTLISKTTYSYFSLLNLFEQYHKGIGNAYQEFDIQPKVKIDYHFVAGITQTKLSLKEAYFREIKDGNFAPSTSITLGVGANLTSPRVNKNVGLLLELLWIKNSFHGNAVGEGSLKYKYDYFVDVTSLKIPLGLQYRFTMKPISPFIKIGFHSEHLLNTNSYGTKELTVNDDVYSYEIQVSEFRKRTYGYWGSIGVDKRLGSRSSIFIECRYEKLINGYFGNGSNATVLSDAASISGFIGFRF